MALPFPNTKGTRDSGWVPAALLALAVAAVSYAAARSAVPPPQTPAPLGAAREAAGSPPVLWTAPEFSLVDQQGRLISTSALRGHVWIANFIFTRCTSVCPTLTAKMRVLQRELAGADLRFLSFSVDPEHDTPSALREYAEVWGKHETRWSLLHTEPGSLQHLSDGMRVVALANGDGQSPILHTSLFFLIDRAGRVRGQYDSNDGRAIQKLLVDARVLAPNLPALSESQPAGGAGKIHFDALGCAGCHDDPKLAPSLLGLWNQAVSLADSTTVRVDEAYVRESISTPSARLVSGFLDLMPAYGSELSDAQLDELVDYVRSLSPAALPHGRAALHTRSGSRAVAAAPTRTPPSAPASGVAEDPVCGMKVRVGAETPRATRDGHSYYFCSASCRDRFLAAPHAHSTSAP